MPMKNALRVNTSLSPDVRPGADLVQRARSATPTEIARRDLARYYSMLERAMRGLRDRFSVAELEALAYALSSMASVEAPELIYLVPATVEEAEQHERLCEQAGLDDCEGLLRRVRELSLAERYALVDAIGQYLELPRDQRGEEGWVGLGLRSS